MTSIAITALLALVSLPEGAQAAPPPPLASPSQPSVAALDTAARAASRAGAHLKAAGLWEQAYQQQQSPELLLLIGDAYSQVNDLNHPGQRRTATVRALRAYRRFLVEEEQPTPEVRAQVLASIRALRQRQGLDLGEATAEPPDSAAGQSASPQALSLREPPPLPDASTPPSGRLRKVALGLWAGSFLLGISGGVLLSQATTYAGEAERAVSYASYLDLRGDARVRLGLGLGFVLAAGAGAVTGALFYLRARRPPRYVLAPALSPGFAGITFGGAR